VSSGFQLDGAEYAVPLVYRVSFLGKLVVEPLPAAVAELDPDADGDVELPVDDELLLQAVATPSAITATAAAP